MNHEAVGGGGGGDLVAVARAAQKRLLHLVFAGTRVAAAQQQRFGKS
jgi:hypothetical protein